MRIQRCGIRKKISNASTAKKEGHSYRNCNQIRKFQCYTCKEEGHIRRYYPNISVSSVWRNNKIKVVILDLTTSDKEEMTIWLQSIQR